MWRFFEKMRKGQKGITGLETAIILIAFIIVASVFAYVVLSAGLFSSQKAKEAVNSGLQSTMSTLEVKGNIIAEMVAGEATDIYISVGIPAAGSPVDFNPASANTSSLIISYLDADSIIPSMNWTINKLTTINSDNLLDPTEIFQIDVDTTGLGIGAYDSFSLEIKPTTGPVLTIERTIPGRTSQYANLY